MLFEQAFNESKLVIESFRRYKLKYVGTREDYKIHDPSPYVLVIDDKYNVDNNGESILGINLNYYKGHKPSLINDINKQDNEAGFQGFETKLKVKKFLHKDKEDVKEFETKERKKRYKNFIDNFPFLGKFIRRYKLKGKDGQPGITSKKRKLLK